jgi:RecA-family ATPase
VVRLPGLPPKGDVSDWLQTHTVSDLEKEIARATDWKPEIVENRLLMSAPEFVAQAPQQIDWLIDGVIERGANGFFVAVPKGGKSWAAIDMVLSLALGVPWMEMRVSRPVRCALISREDNPQTPSWRLSHLFAGKKTMNPGLLESNLYVNSRAQSPELMLDNPEQLAALVKALKAMRIEFAVFDVFNVLHASDENDNTEMRAVLRQLSAIQGEVGCNIGVVHHFNKADTGSLTQRMRGASAIAGWAEWLIGITMADDTTKVRRMEFELKASQPPEAIYYKIDSNLETGICRLARTEPHAQQPIASRAARLMQGVSA